MKPRSINIFLLDGDPNGVRVAQIMMSTIQAIAFRRNKLGEVSKPFPEIEQPGVYILIGEDENEPDRQFAYIGESEAIGDRLATHNSNKSGRDAKEFWTDSVVLISKDENLTKLKRIRSIYAKNEQLRKLDTFGILSEPTRTKTPEKSPEQASTATPQGRFLESLTATPMSPALGRTRYDPKQAKIQLISGKD